MEENCLICGKETKPLLNNRSKCRFCGYEFELLSDRYEPFSSKDNKVFIGKKILHRKKHMFFEIIDCHDNGIITPYNDYTYDELYKEFAFIDGKPCGKLKEMKVKNEEPISYEAQVHRAFNRF